MTMEELLTQLTKKARLECEESHRQFVASMNGLAALDIINQQVLADSTLGTSNWKIKASSFRASY